MTAPKLRFKDFNDYWKNGTLISFSEINPKIKELPQKFIYIDLESVDKGSLILLKNMKLINAPSRAQRLLDKGDILFQMVRPYQQNNYYFNLDGDYVASTGYAQIRVKNGLNSKFIYYALHQSSFLDNVMLRCTGTGYPAINSSELSTINFFVPNELEEQTKIASFLSAMDEKISQLTQKHELLSQYKQGMMQKLFSQQIRFKADDGSEFGEWEDIQLKDFLNLTLRPISKPESNYHALGVRSHFKGLFNKYDSEPEKISMDTLYRVEKDDVVVNITFAWEGAMAIAQSEHDQGLVSHRFPTYRCDGNLVNLYFFKYRFIQKDFLSHLQLCSPGGAGRNRVLNKKAFLEVTFSKPCLAEQTKIANFLSAIDQKIEKVAEQIKESKQWKKGLLQQMFV